MTEKVKISRVVLDELLDLLSDLNVEVDVREDYSGRGMFGDTCLGFVVGCGDVLALGAALGRLAAAYEDRAENASSHTDEDEYTDVSDTLQRMIHYATTDSMGFGLIIYFRGVGVVSEGEES